MTRPAAKQIIIVGPGALGTLFAVRLARSGAAVTILDHRADRAAEIRRDGLRLQADDGLLTAAAVAAESSAARLPAADLIILAVKSTALASAGRDLREIKTPTTILTIQNGLGIIDALRAGLGPDAATHRLIAAVTYQAAHRAPDGLVHQAASLPTFIDGRPELRAAAETIVALFNAAGLPARLEPDLRLAVWRKLIVNASINALTALECVPNGALLEQEHLRRRMLTLARETAAAARADGVAITDDEAEQAALAAATSTARNVSSMRQDLDAGRPTEIEFLNGAVLRLAQAHGLDLPETRTLADAVRALGEMKS
jgi:2-dehydropantoate 2-reductase